MSCLPCKEEIDNGMGAEAARFYAGVVGEMANLRPIDQQAPLFYARVVENILHPLASGLLSGEMGKLTAAQTDALMAQIDKQCYRADQLIVWAQADSADGRIPSWTDELLLWIKDDQTFYTELAAEIGSGGGTGNRKNASASGHK